jgi:dienelactone hydrolase
MSLRYCYGGGVALGVATRSGLVNAVVACHPGPVDIGYIRRATAPLAMICSDGKLNHQCNRIHPFICDLDDEFLPPAKRDRVEVALRENSRIPSKLEVFPGECSHPC